MPKLEIMPSQSKRRGEWVAKLVATLPYYRIVTPADDEATGSELSDADAVLGWVPPLLSGKAAKFDPDYGNFLVSS